jgi:hypothetical protein
MGVSAQGLNWPTANAAVEFGFFFLGELAAVNFEAVFELIDQGHLRSP